MKIKEVAQALERFAPLPLQESYDNAGLQIGLTEAEASGALLCLDVTEEVVHEAVRQGVNLIVAHHPLLFVGLKCVSDATYVERCVRLAIQNGIAIYAAHTNLDNAAGGVNAMMAERLGLTDSRFLTPVRGVDGSEGGSGLLGMLPEAMPATDFLQTVKRAFGVACLQHNGCENIVRTVALCGGSGDFLMKTAAEQGADAFLTGEVGYHRFFGWEKKMLVAALGHFESEQFTVPLLHRVLREACPDLRLYETTVRTNPIHYL